MSKVLTEQFSIDTGAGEVSATMDSPSNAFCTLLFAHGAGADHQHAHMQSLAEAFCSAGMAVLRFNFPFKEAGRNRVDSKAVATATIVDAAQALTARSELPLFVGGHSFGGRMATHAVAEGLLSFCGMILCSFPLHPAGKPAVDRASHLSGVSVPMLFLSGSRDALADPQLMNNTLAQHGTPHTLHWLDTADHSYKILKRTRTHPLNVYDEAAQVARDFATALV
jgi:predicted alpha/beta-hydrolase family hydrolase